MKRSTFVVVLFVALLMLAIPAIAAAAPCESLASLKLPDTTITLAQAYEAGKFEVPAAGGRGGRGGGANPYADLPAFCRVALTIKPSSDSDIKVEVWMPMTGWNGKFQGIGNGAWTGSISTADLAGGLRRGYAIAGTDLGHEGGSASFALGHPEKVIDFGYRATHEMTVKGKAITTAFYDNSAPKYSYFVGCSAGGRQAIKEAQMYPSDYDGVVAGSPGVNWSGRALQTIWVGQAIAKNPLPAAKFPAINAAAIAQCDALDGAKDGIIENPRQCKFDPAVLLCKADDNNSCLTAGQVETAKQIYANVSNSRTKQSLVAGLSPGSEIGWTTMANTQPFAPGVDMFKYVVFGDANWDFKTLNWDSDLDKTLKANVSMDAMDTNLKPFFDRGGKILSYHGWTDPQISPGSTVDYYESVLGKMGGAAKVQENYRLFMIPGMNHCQGGTGADTFDKLGILETWVEKKQAPASITASKMANGQATKTHPLCPYPQTATYKGSGSVDDAASFVCK